MDEKKLYRSENKKICGVCGGIAEYFNLDATVVRAAWIILACCGGSGLLAYLICALIIPER